MAKQSTVKIWKNARLATMAAGGKPYGLLEKAALAVENGRIAYAGTEAELPSRFRGAEAQDCGGRLLTPALIDCHTHLVYAGSRAAEWEARLNGASYEEIARAGGGILSTVRAVREASEDALFRQSLPRLKALMAEGVAVVEIKSGYGLDVENELKMLRVARRLGRECAVTVKTTLLAAHALPPEYRGGDGHAKENSLPLRGRVRVGVTEPQHAMLKNHARSMRSNPTEAEKKLWSFLRQRQMAGAKFRRQETIGAYIVDFVSYDYGVVVELDGGQHAEEKHINHDRERSAYLNAQGFKVLRFWNNEVMENIDGVLEVIAAALQNRPHLHPNPPPEGEGKPPARARMERNLRAEYITLICERIIPAAVREGLADAVDAFCENIGFTREEVARVFGAARAHNLPVKLHAEQLSDQSGTQLAAQYHALSADHLEYVSEEGIKAMATAGTVAVLLPGAFYFLKESRKPPIDLFRKHGVPMAVATDCNPGTSPCSSLLLMLNMACTLFGLTPEEALAGATRHAAQALGMAKTHGVLEVGKTADFALWDVENPVQLVYGLGAKALHALVLNGG